MPRHGSAGHLPKPRHFHWCRLLPAAAESLIELHYAQNLAQSDLCERQLRLEEIAVGVECVQLRVHTSAIPHIGKASAILERRDQTFLLKAALAGSLMRDQCVRDFAERSLNGFFILYERANALGLREFYVRLETACSKDGLAYLRNEAPGAVRAAKQARQLRALAAQQTAETQLRKIRSFGDADIRVRRDQGLFCGTNVGPALEQGRRHPRGHFGRHLLLDELAAADHAAGVLSYQ